MLLPVPMAIRVESNIFAPAPALSALLFVPVQTKRQRRIIPVNIPRYESLLVNKHSVNVPVAVAPVLEPNPCPDVTTQFSNVPLAVKNPKQSLVPVQRLNVPEAIVLEPVLPPKEFVVAVQSSNNPEASRFPNEKDVAAHLRNIPDAVALLPTLPPPKDSLPAEQSSNNPDAKDESLPNDAFPPTHFL
jgi:hypothetical protein